GARAVVESVGDHGCEYMTGGLAVVLGPTGRNFAAGMSGGVAYVLDKAGEFAGHCNQDMVDLLPLEEEEDIAEVRDLITRHVRFTQSALGQEILDHWSDRVKEFVKVLPRDYRRMMASLDRAHESGLEGEDAVLQAFLDNRDETANVVEN
ncbi:MAG TPA: hypothetical protein EYQ31_00885, partial [Candidatus Handelsmanbacteria bacterium]|nr:hypothetical protein [Candidatus Handelsmanbacteria bacterium]